MDKQCSVLARIQSGQILRTFLLAIGVIVCAGLGVECLIVFAGIAGEWLSMPGWLQVIVLALLALGFGVAFYYLIKATKEHVVQLISHVDADIHEREDRRRDYPALIVALSAITDEEAMKESIRLAGRFADRQADPADRARAFCDAKDAFRDFPWLQTVRAIDDQVELSQYPVHFPWVVVLTSRKVSRNDGSAVEDPSTSQGPAKAEKQEGKDLGSAAFFKNFMSLLETLYSPSLSKSKVVLSERVTRAEELVDFEDFREVYGVVTRHLHKLEEVHGRGNVLIDITGGQKPCSITAAMVCLRSPKQRFGYVTSSGACTQYNANARRFEVSVPG